MVKYSTKGGDRICVNNTGNMKFIEIGITFELLEIFDLGNFSLPLFSLLLIIPMVC
jgi:hypothetical protein